MSPRRDPERGRAVLGSRTSEDAPPMGATARRTKPSRLTVDLSPKERRDLGSWAAGAAEELDWPRVDLAAAARILFELVRDDSRVHAEVIERLRSQS